MSCEMQLELDRVGGGADDASCLAMCTQGWPEMQVRGGLGHSQRRRGTALVHPWHPAHGSQFGEHCRGETDWLRKDPCTQVSPSGPSLGLPAGRSVLLCEWGSSSLGTQRSFQGSMGWADTGNSRVHGCPHSPRPTPTPMVPLQCHAGLCASLLVLLEAGTSCVQKSPP